MPKPVTPKIGGQVKKVLKTIRQVHQDICPEHIISSICACLYVARQPRNAILYQQSVKESPGNRVNVCSSAASSSQTSA